MDYRAPLRDTRFLLYDVLDAEAHYARLIDREPITPGSLYELRRKCGKPSCRCANGADLHACLVITWTAKGRKRLRSVPEGEQMRLQELTRRYKLFRKARARLIEVHGKMLAIIDKLEAVRRKEP